MRFITTIQESLKKSDREMAIEMKIYEISAYRAFKKSKEKCSIKNLVKLFEVSGMTAQDFMDLLKAETQE